MCLPYSLNLSVFLTISLLTLQSSDPCPSLWPSTLPLRDFVHAFLLRLALPALFTSPNPVNSSDFNSIAISVMKSFLYLSTVYLSSSPCLFLIPTVSVSLFGSNYSIFSFLNHFLCTCLSYWTIKEWVSYWLLNPQSYTVSHIQWVSLYVGCIKITSGQGT